MYAYKGALCNFVQVNESFGFLEAINNFNEVMFRGTAVELFRFMVDLSKGKYE